MRQRNKPRELLAFLWMLLLAALAVIGALADMLTHKR